MINRTVQVLGCVFVALGLLTSCDRSNQTSVGDLHKMDQSDMVSPVLYLRTSPGLRQDASACSFDFVLFEGGSMVECASSMGKHTPQVARVVQPELNDVLTAVSVLKLTDLPQQANFPPDGRHLEIGIRAGGEIRRYAWSGNDSDLAAPELAAFKKAWGEAMSLIDRVKDRTWNPAPRELLDRVAAQLP